MMKRKFLAITLVATMLLSTIGATAENNIVTTGQTLAFDGDGNIIITSEGDAFYGQDADYANSEFSFILNDDGTTYDNNTGLMWETIPLGGKMTWEEAVEYCENLTLGGYDDWRIPTVEELFSISDFSEGWPYIDTDYFEFDGSGESLETMTEDGMAPQGGGPQGNSGAPQGGDESGEMPADASADGSAPAMQGGSPQGGAPQGSEAGEMPANISADSSAPAMQGQGGMSGAPQGSDSGEMPADISAEGGMPTGDDAPPPSTDEAGVSKDDGQYWTASYNMVEGDERLGDIAFGVNHSTGHIKAYPADSTPLMGKYVRAVRGDVYGAEDYTNNGDGTITDNASGLMWLEVDLGVAVDWEEALALAESSEFAGYDDWRLPDVKELQSIVDYGGSYPAINQDYFECTVLEENENYYFWTSTSAYFSAAAPDYDSAWYVAFGYTSHGAGAVRFSPKYEGSDALAEGEDNILNSVRLVRDVE